jgi:hypothetical protein
MNHNIEGLYIFEWDNGDVVDYIDFSDEYISKKFDIEVSTETEENSNQEKKEVQQCTIA